MGPILIMQYNLQYNLNKKIENMCHKSLTPKSQHSKKNHGENLLRIDTQPFGLQPGKG